MSVTDFLKQNLLIEIHEEDITLPQHICKSCVQQMSHIYSFRKGFIQNESYLNKIVQDFYNFNNDHSYLQAPKSDEPKSQHSFEIEREHTINSQLSNTNEYREIDYCIDNKKIFELNTTDNAIQDESKDGPRRIKKHKSTQSKEFLNEESINFLLKSIVEKFGNSVKEEGEHPSIMTLDRQIEKEVCEYNTAVLGEGMWQSSNKEAVPNNIPVKLIGMKPSKFLTMRLCPYCGKQVKSCKYSSHLRIHTKEKPFQCDICTANFSFPGNLSRHKKMVHAKRSKAFICEICGKSFFQSITLTRHLKSHEEESNEEILNLLPGEELTCEICLEVFTDGSLFNSHKKLHFNEELEEDEDEEKDFKCDVCEKSYTTMAYLKFHQVIHGEKKFQCTMCERKFYRRSGLNTHMKQHSTEKPYSCEFCEKTFAHQLSLVSHKTVHTGEKRFACSMCPKKFAQQPHLTYHLRTHTGERPYACPYCDKRFAASWNMRAHVRLHTGETPYSCKICGKAVRDSKILKKHMREAHEQSAYMCRICDKIFGNSESVLEHLLSHEGAQTDVQQC